LRWPLLQQHLQHASFGGAGEGLRGFGQGEAGGDQLLDADEGVVEKGKRGFKSAAAGADQGEFVDDDRGGIHWDGAMHGGFQDHGAAGTGHGGGGAQSFGTAGGVDHPIVGGDGEGAGRELGLDAHARGDGEFGGVPAELVDATAVGVEDHGDEEAEFAIAQHGDGRAGGDRYLVQDLAGGGQRLQEDGAAGGYVVGENVQIALREGEELGEGAGVARSEEHTSE